MESHALDGLDDSKYGQITRNWRLHFLFLVGRARWHTGNIEGLRWVYDESLLPNPVEAPAAQPYRHLIRGMLRMAERAYAQAEQAFREALREEENFQVTRYRRGGARSQHPNRSGQRDVCLCAGQKRQYEMESQVAHGSACAMPWITPGDWRDIDKDGAITVNDARACTLKCTKASCQAINPAGRILSVGPRTAYPGTPFRAPAPCWPMRSWCAVNPAKP
jgi:hypothetical protein